MANKHVDEGVECVDVEGPITLGYASCDPVKEKRERIGYLIGCLYNHGDEQIMKWCDELIELLN